MTTPLLIGIDGGGTSTMAWLSDLSGKILGRGLAGPSNVKTVGPVAARWALDQSIALAFAEAGLTQRPVAAACLGLAGFDREADREVLNSWNLESSWTNHLVFANDGELVIAAGTPEGWGLAVIAGTGSIAVGRTADGRSARAGGWGPLLGDEGSGYSVAVQALRLVARRFDGRDNRTHPADALTDQLCHALGIDSPARLVAAIYSPDCDRARIAALAVEVIAASEDDPEIERVLLEPAGRELAEAVAAVAKTLGWSSGPVHLGLAGGFLLSANAVSSSLLAHLKSLGYQVETTYVTQPVQGALLLAQRSFRQI
ncbi:N-acetylglucosamine kinase [Singulisphaera acidiphila]|uniref:Putative N-acetylglucosamine kinase n=1 Tax=Singulisphaera acidiphila (strain ATCC BAA-1392 / DSM 18658 / VKM B-2454 / MOB10) TaxID=886293 RepID=L0DD24_SINAD|nr:BadF/BadG/BcrA/BcrD ATPase family protein [Singulisphaera acidiphila]AGA27147.1 putative N-acetylglucosamine kinase [Singulisphaera acidiphila DSM 18658]